MIQLLEKNTLPSSGGFGARTKLGEGEFARTFCHACGCGKTTKQLRVSCKDPARLIVNRITSTNRFQ